MRVFLAFWSEEGFEYLRDITKFSPEAWSHSQLLDVIKGANPADNPLNSMLHGMMLRARFNSQRHYEMYMFTSTDDVDEPSVIKWSEDEPQSLVDWIRLNGHVFVKKAADPLPRRIC